MTNKLIECIKLQIKKSKQTFCVQKLIILETEYYRHCHAKTSERGVAQLPFKQTYFCLTQNIKAYFCAAMINTMISICKKSY